MKEKICAIIVTYNRKKLLLECINSVLKQTILPDAILVVDNFSTDGTEEDLYISGYIQELPPKNISEIFETVSYLSNYNITFNYIRMNENTGGAGGFYEGIKRAYEKGYDWLWLMDDDVEPLPHALETQLNFKDYGLCLHAVKVYNNGVAFNWNFMIDEASGYILNKEEKLIPQKEWICVNSGCFEGMLIHRSIVEKIGYPKKEFFTIGDDTYYGYLSSRFTNNVYINKKCFIKKLITNNSKKYLKPLIVYLYSRNIMGYVARKIATNKKVYIWMTFGLFLNFFLRYIISFKPLLMYHLLKGYIHGLLEKWGGEKKYVSSNF